MPSPVLLSFFVVFVFILVFVGFVASDVLTTLCHRKCLCDYHFIYIGNTQISILLLCFMYLFVELLITISE